MDEKEKELLNFVKGLVKEEEALRKKYNIGDRYRTIANQFKAMLAYVKDQLNLSEDEAESIAPPRDEITPEQQLVYVYLYNARGKQLSRWVNLLSPRNLVEYGVNRPIYADEAEVKAYIRSRPQTDEHAYLVMKVAKTDVLPNPEMMQRDALGRSLLKLKERALRMENLVYFVYKNQLHVLSNGELILA